MRSFSTICLRFCVSAFLKKKIRILVFVHHCVLSINKRFPEDGLFLPGVFHILLQHYGSPSFNPNNSCLAGWCLALLWSHNILEDHFYYKPPPLGIIISHHTSHITSNTFQNDTEQSTTTKSAATKPTIV